MGRWPGEFTRKCGKQPLEQQYSFLGRPSWLREASGWRMGAGTSSGVYFFFRKHNVRKCQTILHISLCSEQSDIYRIVWPFGIFRHVADRILCHCAISALLQWWNMQNCLLILHIPPRPQQGEICMQIGVASAIQNCQTIPHISFSKKSKRQN